MAAAPDRRGDEPRARGAPAAVTEHYNNATRRVIDERMRRPVNQWRCHPRFADLAETLMDPLTHGFAGIKKRFGLLVDCYQSAPGQEPRAPYLLNPELQRPRHKDGSPMPTVSSGSPERRR